jgi:hypothetical protein
MHACNVGVRTHNLSIMDPLGRYRSNVRMAVELKTLLMLNRCGTGSIGTKGFFTETS